MNRVTWLIIVPATRVSTPSGLILFCCGDTFLLIIILYCQVKKVLCCGIWDERLDWKCDSNFSFENLLLLWLVVSFKMSNIMLIVKFKKILSCDFISKIVEKESKDFSQTCSLNLLHVGIKHFHFVNTSIKIKLSTYYMVLRTLVRNSFDFIFLSSTFMFLTFPTKTLMVSQMNDTNNVNILEVEKVVEADKLIVNNLF